MYQMKNIRITITRLILMACLCNVFTASAQQPVPPPDDPFIERLSIDPLSGLITIEWDMPVPADGESPPEPERFVLSWYDTNAGGFSNMPFETIDNPNIRRWDFAHTDYPQMPNPLEAPVLFTVRAEIGTPPDVTGSNRSEPHNNLLVTASYDSCQTRITLNWNRYSLTDPIRVGWLNTSPPFGKPLTSYHVMRIPEGGALLDAYPIGEMGSETTSYIVSNVEPNETYRIFVKAKRSDGVEVYSHSVVIETPMPDPPSFITAVSTEYNSDGIAEITFKLDPNAQTFDYELFGTNNSELPPFISLGKFDISNDEVVLTDIRTHGRTYYYQLGAFTCGTKRGVLSNLATALWLQLKQEESENFLLWDPYLSWDQPAQYHVYRKIGDNPEEIIATITDPAATSHRDNLSDTLIDGDICYWIVATPASSQSSGLQFQAISNTVCIKPESNIFIPKAFLPDAVGINSEFKPFFSYPPEEYMFIVYDRHGAVQFEVRDNVDLGWDGRLRNGRPVSEGVYTYFIRFRTAMGRLIEKRGTFTLLRP